MATGATGRRQTDAERHAHKLEEQERRARLRCIEDIVTRQLVVLQKDGLPPGVDSQPLSKELEPKNRFLLCYGQLLEVKRSVERTAQGVSYRKRKLRNKPCPACATEGSSSLHLEECDALKELLRDKLRLKSKVEKISEELKRFSLKKTDDLDDIKKLNGAACQSCDATGPGKCNSCHQARVDAWKRL